MVKVVSKNYSSGRFLGVTFRETTQHGVFVGVAVVDAETAQKFEGLAGFEQGPAAQGDIDQWAVKAPPAPATVDLASYQAEIESLKQQVRSLDAQKLELEQALNAESGKVDKLQAELKAKKK